MTVGKYYCDYCDKEFQDTPSARKRHLQGLLHQRNRKLWYDSFSFSSDPNQVNVPAPTLGQGVCHHFHNTGFCPYGDSCKYFHPKHNVPGPIIQGTSGFNNNMLSQVGRGPLQGHVTSQSFRMSLGNLPPSLMPPPEGGYPPFPFVDWG